MFSRLNFWTFFYKIENTFKWHLLRLKNCCITLEGKGLLLYTQISCLYNWMKICITNYNIFWLLQGCGFNLWMFFTMNVLWFFTLRTLMQGFVTWSCTNDLQLLRESDRFNSSILRAFDCLDTCTASGLLLHLERLVPNELPELKKEVFEEDSNSSSFEFKIKDN